MLDFGKKPIYNPVERIFLTINTFLASFLNELRLHITYSSTFGGSDEMGFIRWKYRSLQGSLIPFEGFCLVLVLGNCFGTRR